MYLDFFVNLEICTLFPTNYSDFWYRLAIILIDLKLF